MAQIKTYTDLSQSKKLAEILPIETADFQNKTIESNADGDVDDVSYVVHPCWSLAALFGVLPNENMLVKTTDGKYYCLAKDVMTKHYDNPVDACYEVIIKLYELKML